MDGQGRAILVGQTKSVDFPLAGSSHQSSLHGWRDAFVARLSVDGSVLEYATYLGGSGSDEGHSVAVDGAGRAIVVGTTWSEDFPLAGSPHQSSYGGVGDVFVARFSVDGSALEYATYLGGSDNDCGSGWAVAVDVAVDGAGRAIVAGTTFSEDFPLAGSPYQSSHGAFGGDAFVARFSADGSALEYATYLGGSDWDNGNGVAVDGAGRAIVVGSTESEDFPLAGNPYQSSLGGFYHYDAFVARLSADGSALEYATFLGGSGNDVGRGVAVDGLGRAIVVGDTQSVDFPLSSSPDQSSYGGGLTDAFVARLSADGSALEYATYLGGSVYDFGQGVAVDGLGRAVAVGHTNSANFPIAGRPYQSGPGGETDVFVAMLGPETGPVDINGTVQTAGGLDICAMVLASGQYLFSCDPDGVFSLTNLPRETDGTVKLQVYADGFNPYIVNLTESSELSIVMTPAANCPSYNPASDPGNYPGSAGNRIDISGQALVGENDDPICAMVLANGEYMFSCDGAGSYALQVPLDTNGQVKQQVYADGFAPTILYFDEFNANNDVKMARASECQ